MPHYGILRDHKFEGVDDLRGADVYGVNDEKLGTIDDVIFDHSSGDIRYIVLKTGGLLSRKKVMVPASRVEPYGTHDETMKSHSNWAKFEREHNKRWHDGAVMYNQGSGRIITPPPEDVIAAPMGSGHVSAAGSRPDLTPERMGKEDDLLGVASGTGKTTLQPKKPSIGGKEDVEMIRRGQREADERQQREIMNPVGGEIEIPREEPVVSREAMREPGVYKLDPVIETEQGAGPVERDNINRGRR